MVGQQCRWFLEQGGLFPVRPPEVRGLEEALAEALQRLTREELVALWLLALAWGGREQN